MNVYGKQISGSRKKIFGKFVHMVLLKKKKDKFAHLIGKTSGRPDVQVDRLSKLGKLQR